MSLDPKGTGQKRWSNRRKSALNAFEITVDGRLSVDGNNTKKISYTKILTVPRSFRNDTKEDSFGAH
jgi:hypothetical protein